MFVSSPGVCLPDSAPTPNTPSRALALALSRGTPQHKPGTCPTLLPGAPSPRCTSEVSGMAPFQNVPLACSFHLSSPCAPRPAPQGPRSLTDKRMEPLVLGSWYFQAVPSDGRGFCTWPSTEVPTFPSLCFQHICFIGMTCLRAGGGGKTGAEGPFQTPRWKGTGAGGGGTGRG